MYNVIPFETLIGLTCLYTWQDDIKTVLENKQAKRDIAFKKNKNNSNINWKLYCSMKFDIGTIIFQ